MKTWLVIGIAAAALVAIGFAAYLFLFRGPDLRAYEPLRSPRIVAKADMKVVTVEFRGRPEETLMGAFKLLFRVYFSIPGVRRGPNQPAPIARFAGLAGLPNDPVEAAQALKGLSGDGWQGQVGLEVPEAVTSIKDPGDTSPFTVRLARWEYDEVAEILHVGSYDSELPTIARLKEYLHAQGYTIAGDHEEEYLRGPGVPFARPESFYTIIRYPVQRVR